MKTTITTTTTTDIYGMKTVTEAVVREYEGGRARQTDEALIAANKAKASTANILDDLMRERDALRTFFAKGGAK